MGAGQEPDVQEQGQWAETWCRMREEGRKGTKGKTEVFIYTVGQSSSTNLGYHLYPDLLIS